MSNLKYKHTAYTSAQWDSLNPVIVENEIVIESDTKRTKIGNGISTYNELEYADANSVGNSLGSIKPTDAAPTPVRNGNYTFSIGGTKPAWLTAEAGVTTVKAGDGVAVVYTEPSSYTYTHVDVGASFLSKNSAKTPSISAESGFYDINAIAQISASFSRFSYIIESWINSINIKVQADAGAYCHILNSSGEILYSFQNSSAEIIIRISDYPTAYKILICNRNTTLPFENIIFQINEDNLLKFNNLSSETKIYSPNWEYAKYYINSGGVVSKISGGSASSTSINVHGERTINLNVHTAALFCFFTDAFGAIISSFQNNGNPKTVEIPSGAYLLYLNNFTSIAPEANLSISAFRYSIKAVDDILQNLKPISDEFIAQYNYAAIYYVKTTGSNDNVGSSTSPFLTLGAALGKHRKGATTIIIISAGTYTDCNYNLNNYPTGTLIIKNAGDGKVLFQNKKTILSDGSEVLVSGYTKVYSKAVGTNYNDRGMIFQHGINYGLIDISKRMPHHRGQQYRLPFTPINYARNIDNTEFTVVADALNFIENSSGYAYFHDAIGGVLYFSRPILTSSTNPLLYANGSNLLVGSSKCNLYIEGIDCEYMGLSMDFSGFLQMKNVSVRGHYGAGAFRLDNCRGALLERCEAACCGYLKTLGDGFNIHSVLVASVNTEFTYTHFKLIDCWAHDNNDDGYSDHEGCQGSLDGCFSEYNRKGGFTPSTGAHDILRNCISRKNYNGFYYVNNPGDGGIGGNMLLFNCIAEDNLQSGFRCSSNVNNKAELINCKSISNNIGYNLESGAMKAVDCKSLNDILMKSGAVEIVTTNILI